MSVTALLAVRAGAIRPTIGAVRAGDAPSCQRLRTVKKR
jgi:hypothetical protein